MATAIRRQGLTKAQQEAYARQLVRSMLSGWCGESVEDVRERCENDDLTEAQCARINLAAGRLIQRLVQRLTPKEVR